MKDNINRSVFEAYDAELDRVAEKIRLELPHPNDDTLNGYEWCDENDIPQTVFADAVNYGLDNVADYGVSPMYPWKIPEEFR